MPKVEKQTDDRFESRKPKYFGKLFIFGKTMQQQSTMLRGTEQWCLTVLQVGKNKTKSCNFGFKI